MSAGGPPKSLVRSFSSDLQKHDRASQNQLQRIVIAHGKRERADEGWRKYFEPWKPTKKDLEHAFLDAEGVRLSEAWHTFRQRLSPEQQAKFQERAPSMSDVVQLVSEISSEWETKRRQGKFGTAKQYFHKFSLGVNSHITLLEVFPNGSEYVSLFSGVLKSVVKASANHEGIAIGLSKSLNEITNAVNECAEICKLYGTKAIHMSIAMMYAHIFLFLKDAMSWYLDKSWKRALFSLKEDFYEHFAEEVANIKSFAAQVKQQATLGLSAEQRVTRLAVEDVQAAVADMRISLEGQAREVAESAEVARKLARKAAIETEQHQVVLFESPERHESLAAWIDARMGELLEMRATEWLADVRTNATATKSHHHPTSTSFSQIGGASPGIAGREEYMAASRDLELYFSRDQVRLPFDLPPTVGVASRISHGLQDFVANADEPHLAIAGPSSRDHQGLSVMTKVAASFVQYAEEAGLPVISWFCELPTSSDVHGGASVEMTALLSLVYALIRQLIELLPLKPDALISVDLKSLETLDGSSASIDEAFQLLQDLIKQMHLPLFVVIDGLQWLDDVSTDHCLGDFIVTLIKASASTHRADERKTPLVRVFFTTTGRSRALLGILDTSAYLLADEGGHGRKGTGGTSLAW